MKHDVYDALSDENDTEYDLPVVQEEGEFTGAAAAYAVVGAGLMLAIIVILAALVGLGLMAGG